MVDTYEKCVFAYRMLFLFDVFELRGKKKKDLVYNLGLTLLKETISSSFFEEDDAEKMSRSLMGSYTHNFILRGPLLLCCCLVVDRAATIGVAKENKRTGV